MSNYSNHTLVRYNQVLRLIPELFQTKFNKSFKFPESLDENFDEIIQMLSDKYKSTTMCNCISGIIWGLNTFDDKNKYPQEYIQNIIQKYKTFGTNLKEENDLQLINNRSLSEREEKTYQKWEDILNMYKIMYKNLDKTNFNSLLEFVIISLYVLHQPVRSDYANMKVFIDDSFIPKNYKENYCVLQTNPRFVFNKYKTARKYGQIIININEELHNILLDWMEVNPSEYLLVSYIQYKKQYKPFTEETLSHRIPLIFKKYTNIPSNINTLRHSHISYMNKTELNYTNFKEKKETSIKMMHSPNMAECYKRVI
jgi:hypothetical protein